jgi:hypothetical protein
MKKQSRFSKISEMALTNPRVEKWIFSMHEKYGDNFNGWSPSGVSVIPLRSTSGLIKASNAPTDLVYTITKYSSGRFKQLKLTKTSNGATLTIANNSTISNTIGSTINYNIASADVADGDIYDATIIDLINVEIRLNKLSFTYPFGVTALNTFPNILLPNIRNSLSTGSNTVAITTAANTTTTFSMYKSNRNLIEDFVFLCTSTDDQGASDNNVYFGISNNPNVSSTLTSFANAATAGVYFSWNATQRRIVNINEDLTVDTQTTGTISGAGRPNKIFVAFLNGIFYFGTDITGPNITQAIENSTKINNLFSGADKEKHLTIIIQGASIQTTTTFTIANS